MPGSSNFQIFNPAAVNQELDAAYVADSTRTGGIGFNQILNSLLGNKMFYQWSVAIYALMQMMATKGYTVSDANPATLASVLGNLLTNADFASALTTALGASSSFGDQQGYVRLGPSFGGLIVQWGVTAAATAGAALATNFPVPFLSVRAGVFLTPAGNFLNVNQFGVLFNTLTSFTMEYTGSSSCSFFWFAIGK